MITNKISTFAAIKSFFGEGGDYTKAFSFFVLQSLTTKPQRLTDIKKVVLHRFGIDIPIDFIKTLLKRLKKDNYSSWKDISESVLITEQGAERLNYVNDEMEKSERETNALLAKLQAFLETELKIKPTPEIIKSELYDFIKNHTQKTALILKGVGITQTPEQSTQIQQGILKFIEHAQKQDPGNYEVLKALIYGTIISSILQIHDYDLNKKFSELTIYIDTNVLFSLFGWHSEEINQSTRDLFKLIQSNKFILKIFPWTKQEAIGVIRGYIEKYDQYTYQLPVDSIYTNMKRLGLSTQDASLYVYNFDKKLNDMNIFIDYSCPEEDMEDTSQDIKELALRKPPETPKSAIIHDVSSIRTIRKQRGSTKYIIEDSSSIFLTSDYVLFDFDINYHHHNEHKPASIPEVIPRDSFASILWLKNPDLSSDLPIHNVIAGYKSKLIIKNSIWEQFLKYLETMSLEKEISEEDIALILSSEKTQTVLASAKNISSVNESLKPQLQQLIEEHKNKQITSQKATEFANKKIEAFEKENLELEAQLSNLMDIDAKRQKIIEDSSIKKCNKIFKFTYTALYFISLLLLNFIMNGYSLETPIIRNSHYIEIPLLFLFYAIFSLTYFSILTKKRLSFKWIDEKMIISLSSMMRVSNKFETWLIQKTIKQEKTRFLVK